MRDFVLVVGYPRAVVAANKQVRRVHQLRAGAVLERLNDKVRQIEELRIISPGRGKHFPANQSDSVQRVKPGLTEQRLQRGFVIHRLVRQRK